VPAVQQAERSLTASLTRALGNIGHHVAGKLRHLGKAAEEEEDEREAVDTADWGAVAKAVANELEPVARAGAQHAFTEIGITDQGITEQTFTSAAEWARARAAELVGKSWDGDELVDNPDADMAITDTVRDAIREAVADAIEAGDSPEDLADRIEGLGEFSAARAEMIARTEIIRAHASGQMQALRSSGVVKLKGWSTANDDDVDEDCQENEDEGAIGLDDDFPSGDDAPPAHPNCLPGDALVLASGWIAGATKRWYDGDLVVIRTASGKHLACTPNHPILTHGGFIAARLLHKGDEVFSAREGVTFGDDDRDDVPAAIHEVAEAFGRSRQVTSREVPTSAEDFHGDGGGSQVAIVWSDRLLRDRLQAKTKQRRARRALDRAGMEPEPLNRMRTLGEFLHRGLAAASRIVRGGHLGSPLLFRHLAPAKLFRLTLPATRDAGGSHDPGHDVAGYAEGDGDGELRFAADVEPNDGSAIDVRSGTKLDATPLQCSPDRVLTDVVLAREVQDARAGEIFPDPVVYVGIRRLSAHVFNLETTTGWYVANGIVTHNCRCSLTAEVEESDDDDQGDDTEDEDDDEAAE